MVAGLAEDHPVEGPVELHVDPDAGLLALHLRATKRVWYLWLSFRGVKRGVGHGCPLLS